MADKIHIIAMSGSLRKNSFNSALLRTVQELCPAEAVIEVVEIGNLPLYNEDFEGKVPEVLALKEKVKNADAVLFISPEYNYSFSGVLKNAIDWVSRPMVENSWDKKPGGVMGVSTGMFGTARMQYHLRQVLTAINVQVLTRPEVMVGTAKEKFDADLKLIDEITRQKVQDYLKALVIWTKQLQK